MHNSRKLKIGGNVLEVYTIYTEELSITPTFQNLPPDANHLFLNPSGFAKLTPTLCQLFVLQVAQPSAAFFLAG